MNFHRFLALLMLVTPGVALAHIGVDSGAHHGSAFVTGVVHPFTGLDHIVAMVAVGFWSALTMRRVWISPAVFATLLVLGAAVEFSATTISIVEPMIVASVLVLGLLIAARIKLPMFVGTALIGVFAVFHGIAHGGELSSSHAIAALSGMVLGTVSLHVIGLWVGDLARKQSVWVPRAIGATLIVFGTGMLGSAI